MNDKEIETKLVEAVKKLKPGEMRMASVEQIKADDKVIATNVIVEETPEEKFERECREQPKIIEFPGSQNVLMEEETSKKNLKDKWENLKQTLKDNYQKLVTPEDDLDRVYTDEAGRMYEFDEQGNKAYIDKRGFNYYLKYQDGQEIAWVKMTDGSFAEFLDSERTVIRVHGVAYNMDASGKIDYDDPLGTSYNPDRHR